ncbi:MAG: class I SAM-dependent methyltransferase [Fimbriimonas sp.]
MNPIAEYQTPEKALRYLALADRIPHRTEGEAALLELLPNPCRRVLDLGTGDGRLLSIVRLACPDAEGVALDFSPPMLERARARFDGDGRVTVVAHDLNDPLPDLGSFDAIVSSFAIHHVPDERKRAVYAEAFAMLNPGGLFGNLEHVASPTDRLHRAFYTAIGMDIETEDAGNILAPVEPQLAWLREIGFEDVDCYWKWREMALLAGLRSRSDL